MSFLVLLKGLPDEHRDKMALISHKWEDAKANPSVMAVLQDKAAATKDVSTLDTKTRWALIKRVQKKMDKLVSAKIV